MKQDYYGFGNGTLKKDAINDWVLLSSSAANNQTKLTFQRKLITMDANDMDITVNSFFIIDLISDFQNDELFEITYLYFVNIDLPSNMLPILLIFLYFILSTSE